MTLEDLFQHDYIHARYLFEKAYIHHHLMRHEGNFTQTAKTIGMERSSLHRRIKRYRQANGTDSFTIPNTTGSDRSPEELPGVREKVDNLE